MNYKLNDIKKELEIMLFLILFFKVDGFTFRYPMDIFYIDKIWFDKIKKLWQWFNDSKWNIQLYIHSIFCWTRCNYCDCRALLKNNDDETQNYKKYIFDQLDYYSTFIKKEINSIYFWWWTFNLWSDAEIVDICEKILKNYKLAKNYIWQVEIHPYFLTKNTLKILKNFWVTDIMLGIQTISPKVNKLNNRPFDIEKINFALKELKNLGFRKVSFDFLYNLPYMTLENIKDDMEFIYKEAKKLKENWIKINIEINRWDLSMRTGFANIFLNKFWKEKFFEISNYYVQNSKKAVKIVDYYIENKFIDLFDTSREEIEERKLKNTAILWIWVSATSYIPWKIVYEDMNYNLWDKQKLENLEFNCYALQKIDNNLSYISDNLRRWIPKKIFYETLEKSDKLKDFFNYYNNRFFEEWGNMYFKTNSDIENDLLNLYLIDEQIFLKQYNYLKSKWEKLGFSTEELKKYSWLFLDYYYSRNKLFW